MNEIEKLATEINAECPLLCAWAETEGPHAGLINIEYINSTGNELVADVIGDNLERFSDLLEWVESDEADACAWYRVK